MTRHRGNSKIKREHSMIDGLDKYLQSIEPINEIQSIVPGIINTRKASSGFRFSVQYPTDSGLKCIAKNQGSVQDVHITSKEPMIVWQKIEGDV